MQEPPEAIRIRGLEDGERECGDDRGEDGEPKRDSCGKGRGRGEEEVACSLDVDLGAALVKGVGVALPSEGGGVSWRLRWRRRKS